MHGQVNCQDKATGSFALPANGRTELIMSSRVSKAPPPHSNGNAFRPSNPDYVLTRAEWGNGPQDPGNTLQGEHNIHAYTRDDPSGCALAIAYKSDARDVNPEDFVVFTVVRDCPKRQREPIDIPNLPACPDGNCICSWFWIPKNSGAKNFYMTPFVCHVTGADPAASPVDVAYAIPPRRCLDPNNCNFGPRLPEYWLGQGSQINMPENNLQSPHYSILYGFREGAQNDIFVNSNPRRHVVQEVPPERKCSGKRSRIMDPSSWSDLTSPDCGCTAVRQSNGEVRIYDGSRRVSTLTVGGNFGPRDVAATSSFKADARYFPTSTGPYTMDLSDKCYLFVTDRDGLVVWESMVDSGRQNDYVNNVFTGFSPDPSEWPADGAVWDGDGNNSTRPPTSSPPPTPTPPPTPNTSPPGVDTLSQGEQLYAGGSLWSKNGEYELVLQASDGNFVGYDRNRGGAFWSTRTAGGGGERVSVQGDGNCVLYSRSGTPLWSTGTHQAGSGARLVMQDDRNIVLYSRSGQAVWTSDTGGQNSCPDNTSFRDENGYGCRDWVGYDCSRTYNGNTLSTNGRLDLKENCRQTCNTQTDDASFVDENGYGCRDWAGYDCSRTYNGNTLTSTGRLQLNVFCPQTCGHC
jgi:hypothetical protein